MEQDVDTGYRTLCCTCLSSDRNVTSINGLTQVYQMFRLIMYDYAGDRFGDSVIELDQLVCWECLALMKKLARFKRQVHSAQEHLRVLAMSQSQETMDHTYMSQSLSSLESVMKTDFDQILVDYTMQDKEWPHYISISTEENVKNEGYDVAQALRDHITLSIDDQVNVMGVPELVLENPVTGVMSHIVVNSGSLVTDFHNVKREMPELTIDPTLKPDTVIISQNPRDAPKIEKPDLKSKYTKEYMTEEEMLALREEAKQKVQYVSSVYKCELCIIGFYTQQQVEDHFVAMHREKPGYVPCKVCYIYTPEAKMSEHTDTHYSRYVCKLCNKHENSQKLMLVHLRAHENKTSRALIPIDVEKKSRKKKGKIIEEEKTPPKPGDLRKLLSKTTIVGYKCLECDMFFKNSRARKNHVDRFHREGLQCDHCKKRFVNRTTLATHLRLHEGPLPREECPVCHKMVRTIQIKYHIQRHQSTTRYECRDCDKVFSHLATYQAHLKFSRAHASDQVFNAIEMEVVPDIYQPSPQTRPYSNAERQKRYRDKKKAGKMTSSASTSFSESNNVETQQEQHHYVQINKHQPQSNAERQRKYRKLLREKLQKQQKEDINKITPTNGIHHLQKFPCPMCNKGYPTKQAMQDHFNYQHLNKTTHKCPVCSKPIASKANVEKHMMRVHGEKKSKPKKHVCQLCGKGFTDKKALTQHEVIHSGERPLSCDICQQTFKQKASLYTHKKRVHKVFPTKRVVEFMDTTD